MRDTNLDKNNMESKEHFLTWSNIIESFGGNRI